MADKALEERVKEELGLKVLKGFGMVGGGCINTGSSYETDKYGKVFIKVNPKSGVSTSLTILLFIFYWHILTDSLSLAQFMYWHKYIDCL